MRSGDPVVDLATLGAAVRLRLLLIAIPLGPMQRLAGAGLDHHSTNSL
jgi:hypothetical protein